MTKPAKVLLIEDDTSTAESLERVLRDDGYEVTVVGRGDEGMRRACDEMYDVVVTDMKLPGMSGLELIRRIRESKPRLPIILITAHGTTDVAIEATRSGAYDYLLKPFEMPEFLDLIDRAVTSSRIMSRPVEMGAVGAERDAIVGSSRAMQNLYKEIGRVADKPVTVLIRGETGTGKELVARAIYQYSERKDKPFIAMNCAAIPETLLESDLFGHERGAFTGAELRRIGRFEQANHGTVFLDEIGDLSAGTQAKLLRVLQEKCLERLGSRETIPIDVRVIAATHCNLEQAMRDKTFREDLFFRLSVVVLTLPPLRDRLEDVPALAKHFMRRYGVALGVDAPSISEEALQYLQEQQWPGNVRELENTIRNALLIARGYTINVGDLIKVTKQQGESNPSSPGSISKLVEEMLAAARQGRATDVHSALFETMERELFAQAILLALGNQAKAARWLGVSRITMREKLNRFGLHPSQQEKTG